MSIFQKCEDSISGGLILLMKITFKKANISSVGFFFFIFNEYILLSLYISANILIYYYYFSYVESFDENYKFSLSSKMSKSLSVSLSLSLSHTHTHTHIFCSVSQSIHCCSYPQKSILLLLSDEEFHKISEVVLFSWSLSPPDSRVKPKVFHDYAQMTLPVHLSSVQQQRIKQHVHSYLFVPFRLYTWPGILFSPSLPWRIRCIFCESFYHVTNIDYRQNEASSSLSLWF